MFYFIQIIHSSAHGTCLLLIKEHLIEKIVTIWKEEEDMETKVLCGMVINTVGAFNNTTASSHTLISGLLALASVYNTYLLSFKYNIIIIIY